MGQNKAFLELGGRPLIEIVIERMGQVCDEVLVVAADARPFSHLEVPVVEDIFAGTGVLGGLHAGLSSATHDVALAVGCDMPFLSPALLRALWAWVTGVDVVVLRQGEHVEPLHGAYRRACIGAIEHSIRSGERRIVSFFPRVKVRYVDAVDAMVYDEGLRSIRNVNTPDDWLAVQAEWRAVRS
jgi:molybdopterin-guanine dinucleotide biosynthesis protein A